VNVSVVDNCVSNCPVERGDLSDPVEGRIHMQTSRTLFARILFVGVATVAPLAFAIPAQAQGDSAYTCDTVKSSDATATGTGNCTAPTGKKTSGAAANIVLASSQTMEQFMCRFATLNVPNSVAGRSCAPSPSS
jgi:hypothetical protein